MTKYYTIEGMTCGGCVASVRRKFEQIKEIEKVDIQLESPQGMLQFSDIISLDLLQVVLGKKYTIHDLENRGVEQQKIEELPKKFLSTYKPLFLIVIFIAGVTLLAQYPFDTFSGMLWMRHFMAGFFIVFAFFKLLNLEGFAQTYQMYDVLAKRWKFWAYVYPFVELILGVLYLINIAPVWTSVLTIIVLGLSSIGVIQSVLDRKKIKCACLGDVFNLPMSTVTIVEDLAMVAMASGMLLLL